MVFLQYGRWHNSSRISLKSYQTTLYIMSYKYRDFLDQNQATVREKNGLMVRCYNSSSVSNCECEQLPIIICSDSRRITKFVKFKVELQEMKIKCRMHITIRNDIEIEIHLFL